MDNRLGQALPKTGRLPVSNNPKPVIWYKTIDGWVVVAGFLFIAFLLVSCTMPGQTSDKAWGQYTEALKRRDADIPRP